MAPRFVQISLGFAAIVTACAPRPHVITGLPDSVTALAFNAVLTQNGSGVKVSVYCVRIVEHLATPAHWKYRDPSTVVTRQIGGSGRDVRPFSGCPTRQQTVIGPLIDTSSGGQAMVLTLQDSIHWAHDTLIVWGGYSCGGLCGGGGPIRLWRRSGAWQALFRTEVVS